MNNLYSLLYIIAQHEAVVLQLLSVSKKYHSHPPNMLTVFNKELFQGLGFENM